MYRPRSWSSISSLRTGRPLADGTWARTRIWSGVDSVIGRRLRRVRGGTGSSAGSPFVRVEDEAGQGLGVEVGRLLGHDTALAGDGGDRFDRGRLEEERGIGPVRAGIDRLEGLLDGLREAEPIGRGDRLAVDPGELLQGRPEQDDVEAAQGRVRRRAGSWRTPGGGRTGSRRPSASRGRTGPRRRAGPRSAPKASQSSSRSARRTSKSASRPSHSAATPASPRPRTIRCVGRTVSGSAVVSRNSIRR